MKKLIIKIKAILSGRGGESLMESIASLLIFTILLMGITAMIRVSAQISTASTRDSTERQEEANAGIMEDYAGAGTNPILHLQGSGIDVSIAVERYNPGGYEAFKPEVS